MKKAILFGAALLGLLPAFSPAVEITDLRATNGPLGALRTQLAFLPGDAIFLTFDLADLMVDKDGHSQFQIKLEVVDASGKRVYGQEGTPANLHLLGGKKLPSQAYVFLDPTWAAGKYQLKLTATDRESKASKTAVYNFELLKSGFGLVQPAAPGVIFAGLDMQVSFAVVGMKRDTKKMPDVSLKFQMLDNVGKPIFAKPLVSNIKDLHQEKIYDLTQQTIIPVKYPLFPTRPGTYSIEIEAYDQLGKEKATLRFPLRVLDPAEYTVK